MQVFDIIWLRWLLVMMLGGLALAFILYLAFGASFRRSPTEELEEYPAGIQVGNAGTPAVLILLFAIIGAAMIGYLWHAWASGAGF